MPGFGPVFERVANAPDVARGLPLVVAMTGFTDAGSAVSGLIDYTRQTLDPQPLLVFSNDALLDYRARRPVIAFDEDHLTDYVAPRLELAQAHDALGQPFLLLSGYEPDFGWDAFAAAVLDAAEELRVATVTWVHAIPMPVPHTRPIGTTVSGTREDITAAHSVWKPRTQAPATAGHLLEYRFAEAGASISSFVLLIPHYLGDTEYPGATIVALDKLSAATGLVFTTDDLRADDGEFLAKVAEQVEGNDELTRMVHNLEERYDSYMAGTSLGAPLIDEGSLPSADELAAELERFLASRPPGDEDRHRRGRE